MNPEILGWASAQIVCICSINPRLINPEKLKDMSLMVNSQRTPSLQNTSLSPSRYFMRCNFDG